MHEPIEVRVAILETQVHRLVSDVTSEKETRARSNSNLSEQLTGLDDRQRKIEKIIYMGLGGLAALQFIIAVVKK